MIIDNNQKIYKVFYNKFIWWYINVYVQIVQKNLNIRKLYYKKYHINLFKLNVINNELKSQQIPWLKEPKWD